VPKAFEIFRGSAGVEKIARPRAAAQRSSVTREGHPVPPSAHRVQLSRPPCVTVGQLLRVTLLVLGAAIYADRAPPTADSPAPGGQSQSALNGNVDLTPVGSIGPARQIKQSRRH